MDILVYMRYVMSSLGLVSLLSEKRDNQIISVFLIHMYSTVPDLCLLLSFLQWVPGLISLHCDGVLLLELIWNVNRKLIKGIIVSFRHK